MEKKIPAEDRESPIYWSFLHTPPTIADILKSAREKFPGVSHDQLELVVSRVTSSFPSDIVLRQRQRGTETSVPNPLEGTLEIEGDVTSAEDEVTTVRLIEGLQ